MKKLLLLLLCTIGAVATSCEFLEEFDGEKLPIRFEGNVEDMSLLFSSDGVVANKLHFTALCDWEVTTNESWLHITELNLDIDGLFSRFFLGDLIENEEEISNEELVVENEE